MRAILGGNEGRKHVVPTEPITWDRPEQADDDSLNQS